MRRVRRGAARIGLTLLAGAALAACGFFAGEARRETSAEVSATLIDGVETDCSEVERDLCEQAVSAIVNGLPAGDSVTAITLAPLDRELAITPEPAWAASARAEMRDGFVYDLILIQEVQPGPIEINFAPD